MAKKNAPGVKHERGFGRIAARKSIHGEFRVACARISTDDGKRRKRFRRLRTRRTWSYLRTAGKRAPGHYDASRHAVVDTDKLIIIFITFFIIYIFQRLSLRLPFLRILRRPVAYWPSLPKLPCRQTRTPSRCDARYNMLYKYYINHSNDILFNKARRSAVLPRNFQSLKTPYTEDSRSLTLRGSGEHESPQKRRGVFSKGK